MARYNPLGENFDFSVTISGSSSFTEKFRSRRILVTDPTDLRGLNLAISDIILQEIETPAIKKILRNYLTSVSNNILDRMVSNVESGAPVWKKHSLSYLKWKEMQRGRGMKFLSNDRTHHFTGYFASYLKRAVSTTKARNKQTINSMLNVQGLPKKFSFNIGLRSNEGSRFGMLLNQAQFGRGSFNVGTARPKTSEFMMIPTTEDDPKRALPKISRGFPFESIPVRFIKRRHIKTSINTSYARPIIREKEIREIMQNAQEVVNIKLSRAGINVGDTFD